MFEHETDHLKSCLHFLATFCEVCSGTSCSWSGSMVNFHCSLQWSLSTIALCKWMVKQPKPKITMLWIYNTCFDEIILCNWTHKELARYWDSLTSNWGERSLSQCPWLMFADIIRTSMQNKLPIQPIRLQELKWTHTKLNYVELIQQPTTCWLKRSRSSWRNFLEDSNAFLLSCSCRKS